MNQDCLVINTPETLNNDFYDVYEDIPYDIYEEVNYDAYKSVDITDNVIYKLDKILPPDNSPTSSQSSLDKQDLDTSPTTSHSSLDNKSKCSTADFDNNLFFDIDDDFHYDNCEDIPHEMYEDADCVFIDDRIVIGKEKVEENKASEKKTENELLINAKLINNKTLKRKKKKRTPEEIATEKAEKERRKHEKLENKRIRDKLREKDKEKRKAIREAAQTNNLDNCQKFCKMIICNKIFDLGFCSKLELEQAFALKGSQIIYTLEPIEEFGVYWKREKRSVQDDLENDEFTEDYIVVNQDIDQDHLLILLNDTMFIPLLEDGGKSLNDYFIRLVTKHKKFLTLVFYGVEAYYRKQKNLEHKEFLEQLGFEKKKHERGPKQTSNLPTLSKSDIEKSIAFSYILFNDSEYSDYNVNIVMADSQSDVVRILSSYTKAVATSHLKQQIHDQHGLDWFAQADVGAVDLKSDEDVMKLWINQLMSFPKVGYEMAKSIAKKYPTPQVLLKELEKCQENKEDLLSAIQVKKNNYAMGVSVRNVGKTISRRICSFMLSRKGNEVLH